MVLVPIPLSKNFFVHINNNKEKMISECSSTNSIAMFTCRKTKLWQDAKKRGRRKVIRQKRAQTRDAALQKEQEEQEKSASYQTWRAEQERFEQLAMEEAEKESERQHVLWLAREALAQEKWKQGQSRREKAKKDREAQEQLIREEWEARERKEREEREAKEKLAADKKQEQVGWLKISIRIENWLQQLQDFVNNADDQMERRLTTVGVPANGEVCGFFAKIGVCRFGDFCSRIHNKPSASTTLLIKGFFHYLNLRSMRDEHDTDMNLEFEESEVYLRYLEFSGDVLPEFQKYGQVVQFKVCCNMESHLRGNVYVQFATLRQAVHAFTVFNGRWYSGRQLTIEFVTVSSWKSAICGLFSRGRCPKGQSCNFLHVFRHPGNAFGQADRDWPLSRTTTTATTGDGVPRQQQRHRSHHARSSRSCSRSPSCSRNRERAEDQSRNRSSETKTTTGTPTPNREANRKKRSRSKSRSKETTTREWRWSESPEPVPPLFADSAASSSLSRLPGEEKATPKEAICHSHHTPSTDARKEAQDKHRHRRHSSKSKKKSSKKKHKLKHKSKKSHADVSPC